MLASQLEKLDKCQLNKADESGKKITELALKLCDVAYKKDVKEAETRVDLAVDSRLALAERAAAQKITDFQKQTLETQQELAEQTADSKKRVRGLEKQQAELSSKAQLYTDDKIGQATAELKKLAIAASESAKNALDELAAKLREHEAAAKVWRREIGDEQDDQNKAIDDLKARCEALEGRNAELEKETARSKGLEERLMERMEKRIAEQEAKRKAEREEEAKKNKELEDKIREMSLIQGDFATGMNELKENGRIREEEAAAGDQERDEKLFKLEKEVTELQAKCESLGEDAEAPEKVQELEAKVKAIEAELEKRQQFFAKYDAQMKSYDERYSTMELRFQKSADETNERCKRLEQAVIHLSDSCDASFGQLKSRVDELERRLRNLRLEIRDTLLGYAKELRSHRATLNRLAKKKAPARVVEEVQEQEEPEPEPERVNEEQEAQTPKRVANVGVNVVMGEKQMTTVQVGTENRVNEIEVQTDSPEVFKEEPVVAESRPEPPIGVPAVVEEKEEEEEEEEEKAPEKVDVWVQEDEPPRRQKDDQEKLPVFETIVNQDARAPVQAESSSIFNDEGNRVVSEHESEEEEINLNPLKEKSPRPVSYFEAEPLRSPEKPEEAAEFGKRRSPQNNLSVQTYQEEMKDNSSRRNMSLQVPSVRDFLGGSPHYLREDPIRSKDKKSIIGTQGVSVEQNISSRNFRQPEKFNVNIDEMAKVEQEEAPRVTYAEVVNYNNLNFENYNPPPPEEESLPSSARDAVNKADIEAAKVLETPPATPPKIPTGAPLGSRSGEGLAKAPLEALPEVAEGVDSPAKRSVARSSEAKRDSPQSESPPPAIVEPEGKDAPAEVSKGDAAEGSADGGHDQAFVQENEGSRHEEMLSDEAIDEANQMLEGLKSAKQNDEVAQGEDKKEAEKVEAENKAEEGVEYDWMQQYEAHGEGEKNPEEAWYTSKQNEAEKQPEIKEAELAVGEQKKEEEDGAAMQLEARGEGQSAEENAEMEAEAKAKARKEEEAKKEAEAKVEPEVNAAEIKKEEEPHEEEKKKEELHKEEKKKEEEPHKEEEAKKGVENEEENFFEAQGDVPPPAAEPEKNLSGKQEVVKDLEDFARSSADQVESAVDEPATKQIHSSIVPLYHF